MMIRQYTINLLNFAGHPNLIFMANKFFLIVVKDIISNPVKTWESIDSDNKPVRVIRNTFLFPLIALVSVSAIAGSLIFTDSQLSPIYSLFTGIKCFILLYITIYASAYVLKEITYPLDLGRNFDVSFRLLVFSAVPLLLCQLFSRLFESLLFVNVISLFGLYIFWTGIERLLTPPVHKKIPLLIATFITFTAIFIGTDLLLSKLIDKIYYSFFV
jgi:hypothetical protein